MGYIEDFKVGDSWVGTTLTLSLENIVSFGLKFDPQPFHTDPAVAQKSPFGGIVASGWQLAAIASRLCPDIPIVPDNPLTSIGIDELRWFKPVRVGDTVTTMHQVIDVDRAPNLPEMGIVRVRIDMKNQHGELVMRLVGPNMLPSRATVAGETVG
ncbi:MaoC/PaaZ C-terminal domain-containing protein [Cupriavidus sp. WKF15]|uniref:MaoC/PaaZ C-terminal domain-containing protein n=1 Tax=Cupriavidus sp. WKF15 TaxID=3032282 RepID=UPI0023E113F6|nr:MaoC/PaaZ C-terminal domain-containing protein [Cupriavidus sp. WKF15]WER50786.1 MaoC/PaaZ C-terminal domain-containing protein [Cupriavidus sp. WKF15]